MANTMQEAVTEIAEMVAIATEALEKARTLSQAFGLHFSVVDQIDIDGLTVNPDWDNSSCDGYSTWDSSSC